jgi:Na+-translocating ferredoxin:NAD+ oxidoreductase subunit B
MMKDQKLRSRRSFLRDLARYLVLGGLGGLAVYLHGGRRRSADTPVACAGRSCEGCPDSSFCRRPTVWQLDPAKCVQCGRCATRCVLNPSAVKCVHAYALCGYCKLCFGYFQPGATVLDSAAENQLCPTGAIKRRFVEDPYHEYTIDESLCIGCGKCVKGCNAFGNGSLFLQVRHDRCVNCNECSIAIGCPARAYVRVPANRPYMLKTLVGESHASTSATGMQSPKTVSGVAGICQTRRRTGA